MDKKITDQLINLREKYRKGIVSVIVGAGFSCNACEAYPSWKELLYDMVVELYEEEIEDSFVRYISINRGSEMTLEKYTKQEVSRIIERVGYLKIVSEYIARKGYREAIEHYIEERIPYIDAKTQQFKFAGKYKSNVIDIEVENFSAHKKLLEGEKWERIYTTNYDRLLEYAKEIGEKKYSVITKARDLSVSKETPSIIKLHGDLYDPKDKRVFMFDGNPHQQYIISEEDYKNYPLEHEAFTQLMRISLLQGAFCLIGFSGDDPNFINWISWVRDVIVTEEESGENASHNSENLHKIFMIGLAKDEPDEVRKIFYDNHNIVYVPLLSDDVREFINAKDTDEPRDLFCRFFDFLYEEQRPSSDVIAPDDIPNRKAYDELWDSVYKVNRGVQDNKLKLTVTIDAEKLEKLYSLKQWNRIVVHTQQQSAFLRDLRFEKSLSKDEVKLALLALADTGLTVDNDFINKVKKSEADDDLKKELERYIERTKTLIYYDFDGEPAESVETYDLILRNLYVLDFKNVRELLDKWTPSGTDVIKKAVVLSLFDKTAAKDMLVDYINREPNVKEQYYATRLLNLIEDTYPFAHKLDRFVNANVQDYYKVMSTLIKRTNEKKEKIGRYGDGKNEKVNYIGNSEPSKIIEATELLHFIIEAPAFVSYKNFYTLINSDEWYNVHKNIYEQYPLAVLYYGLQCADDKIKTRIGQDFSYSDCLAKKSLGRILTNLLKAYLVNETPYYLKEPILIVSKEMFVSVRPSKWEGLFMQIWNDVVLRNRFEDDNRFRFDNLDGFVNKALSSMKNHIHRQKIICDLLTRPKESTGFVIDCLYYLQVSPADYKDSKELQNVVGEFLKEIDTPSELNVAGNIYKLLTKEQKELCAKKCLALLSDKTNDIDNLVYHVSQFFLQDNAERRAVLINSIINNPMLWENGITGPDSCGSFTYLRLSDITRRVYIDRASLIIIFNKLKISAEKLVTFVGRHKNTPFFSDMDGLLSEMLTFLNYHEKRLRNENGYYELRKQVSEAYHKVSGLNSVEDGLLSEYDEEVSKSLKYIEANRYTLTHKELVQLFDIVINRVLLQNSDGLDICIMYLRLFLQEGLITMDDEGLINGLVRILDRFEKDDVQRCNMDLVVTSLNLAKIARFLSGRGVSSNGIDYWMRFNKKSRFYTNFS